MGSAGMTRASAPWVASARKCLQQSRWHGNRQSQTGAPLYSPARPSSALFGSLREKRLELRHNLGAFAVRALNALLFVLTDRHSKGETGHTSYKDIRRAA